jgi:type IV pilus assembly protein PilP
MRDGARAAMTTFVRGVFNVAAPACFAALSACVPAGPGEELHGFLDRAAKEARGSVAPIPSLPTGDVPVYTAGSMRDPFASDEPRPAPRPPRSGPPQPLESFDLESLRLVGIFARGSERYILVKAPTGHVFGARPGDRIGRDGGEIRAIDASGADIVEPAADAGVGERKTRLVLQ